MCKGVMAKISCIHYGFDCKFEVEVDDNDAINRFQKHSMVVHGIEYNSGAINQILVRVRGH
jgi:predicted small metal-binding protein